MAVRGEVLGASANAQMEPEISEFFPHEVPGSTVNSGLQALSWLWPALSPRRLPLQC